MKKLLIFLLLGAAFIYFRQPGYEKTGQIKAEQSIYDLFDKDDYLYIKTNEGFNKIINEKVIDFKIYDIDADDNDEILIISKSAMDQEEHSDLVIYETDVIYGQIKIKEIYRQDFSEIKPWKVDVCNLDNDGEADIFIGVQKDTLFYKDVRKRPFFYSWDGKHLSKKWLGSFFTDWELIDIAFGDYYNLGYDLAAVLEKNNESYRVGIYKFIGFGFENMDTSQIYTDVRSIETSIEDGKDALTLNFNGIRKGMHITYIKNN